MTADAKPMESSGRRRSPAVTREIGFREPPRMVSAEAVERLAARLCALVEGYAAAHPDAAIASHGGRAGEAVREFLAIYPDRPVPDNKGGNHFNGSLWIFVITRLLSPRLIIESGVFRGHTTWLLRQASPAAEIHSFDVDFGNLVHRDADAVLHECDWSEIELPAADGAESLAFFDDHISHARRIGEAYDRGFRRLLFDDNFSADTLYAVGTPPVPTVDMLLDDGLEAGTELAWLRNGKRYTYRYDDADADRARRLIAYSAVLPDAAPITRYPPGSRLTEVRLVP
jgi:hypothetical protein